MDRIVEAACARFEQMAAAEVPFAECMEAAVDAALAAARAAPAAEPVAWARRWHIDGETPEKERNANGRMAWPAKFKMMPVTVTQALPDDVPLYTAPPPAEASQQQASPCGEPEFVGHSVQRGGWCVYAPAEGGDYVSVSGPFGSREEADASLAQLSQQQASGDLVRRLNASLRDLLDAMHAYGLDVSDHPAPHRHRQMMQRAEAVLEEVEASQQQSAEEAEHIKALQEDAQDALLTEARSHGVSPSSQQQASVEKAELIAAPVLVDGEPDAHTLKLKIGVQQFRIGDYFDTREKAEWMAGQLRHALTAIRFDALRVAGISELKAEISRLTADLSAAKAEAEALRKLLIEADAELDRWDDGKKGRRDFDLEARIDAAIAAQGEKS